jgi:UDP-glucose 4-epimerase
MAKTYVVTGASGFIGGSLVAELTAQGYGVRPIDLATGQDIRKADTIERAINGADGCFHLAAIASVQACLDDPATTLDINVKGTQSVMVAAAKAGIPVVYASSAAIYGDLDTLPLREDMAPRPLSLYAMHKLANEATARALGAQMGLQSCGMRFFNVYGKGQQANSPYAGVISRFFDRLLKGQPLRLQGDGSQTRDFVAVHDAVQALLCAMETGCTTEARAYNIATSSPISLVDLIAAMENVTGQKAMIEYDAARLGDIRHSQGDASAFTGLTGWTPKISLEDGLAAMLDKQPSQRQSAQARTA